MKWTIYQSTDKLTIYQTPVRSENEFESCQQNKILYTPSMVFFNFTHLPAPQGLKNCNYTYMKPFIKLHVKEDLHL